MTVGTILAELKNTRLTLFSDEISTNVDAWKSMIDYLGG